MNSLDILEAIGSHADASTRTNMCLASKDYLNSSHDFLKHQKVMKQLEAVTKEVRKIVINDNQEFYNYLTIYGYTDMEEDDYETTQDIIYEESSKWDIIEFMSQFWDYHFNDRFTRVVLHTLDTSNF